MKPRQPVQMRRPFASGRQLEDHETLQARKEIAHFGSQFELTAAHLDCRGRTGGAVAPSVHSVPNTSRKRPSCIETDFAQLELSQDRHSRSSPIATSAIAAVGRSGPIESFLSPPNRSSGPAGFTARSRSTDPCCEIPGVSCIGVDPNLPVDWDFCDVQAWLGLLHQPPGGHDIDPLVPQDASGFDEGSAEIEGIGPVCPDHQNENGLSLQEAFDNWTELTMVQQYGGAAWGCANGFPCNQWRTVTKQVSFDLDFLDPCIFAHTCPAGPWTYLWIGPWFLQWFWLCGRMTGPVLDAEAGGGRLHLVVERVNPEGNGTILYSDYQDVGFNNVMNPTITARLSGRCRQRYPFDGLLISMRRIMDDPGTEVFAPIEVTVLGRLGSAF